MVDPRIIDQPIPAPEPIKKPSRLAIAFWVAVFVGVTIFLAYLDARTIYA